MTGILALIVLGMAMLSVWPHLRLDPQHVLLCSGLTLFIAVIVTQGNTTIHENPEPMTAPANGVWQSPLNGHIEVVNPGPDWIMQAISVRRQAARQAAYWAGVRRYVVAMCHDGHWHAHHITQCNQVMHP